MKTNLEAIYNDIFKKNSRGLTKFGQYFMDDLDYGKYNENDFRKKIELLYENYKLIHKSLEYDSEVYAATVRDTIRSYSRNKDVLIDVYKKFSKHLGGLGLEVVVEFPPIPVSNTFERLMFISKYLQDDTKQISDLPDVLLQSERTIEDDIKKLRGLDGDPLQVCGQKFVIEKIERSKGHISFASTAHPLFLTSNLTQVVIMLEGLREQAKRPEFEAYAMSTASSIWTQLSDYAKKRIFYLFDELWTGEKQWYQLLDDACEYAFYDEQECSEMGHNVYLECLKSGGEKTCIIEYMADEGSVFYKNAEIIGLREDTLEIRTDGKEFTIEIKRIIQSSYYAENMF